jgi:hypothetical protein
MGRMKDIDIMQQEMMDPSQFEDEEFRRCQQLQCGFFTQGGCKPCADCKAGPFNIRKSCERCCACEEVPDSLRWDDELTKRLGMKKVKRVEV